MLVWFPNFREDELFHSAVARYADIVRYPNEYGAFQDVFDSKNSVSAYLPHNLQHFLDNLPGESEYTLENLINNHTVFPFHAPFLPPEQRENIKRGIASSESNMHIFNRLGLVGQGLPSLSRYFHYCPLCVQQDRAKYDSTYWHRTHQLPGVKVCPTHGCWLEASSVMMHRKAHAFYESAEKAILDVRLPRLLKPNNRVHQLLLEIAQEASWLLKNPTFIQDNLALQSLYYSILFESGLVLENGRLANRKKLLHDFREFCPDELLVLLGCEIVSEDWNWVIQIMAKGKGGSTVPIHHLIFMRFLGYKFEELSTVKPLDISKPFGDGPWPCLNPICPSYRKPSIYEIKVVEKALGKGGGKCYVGEFKCECGFSYLKNSHNKVQNNFKQVKKIIAYGDLWENEFVAMWTNPQTSAYQLSLKFHIPIRKVVDTAYRLGLDLSKYKGIHNPSVGKVMISQKDELWVEKRDIFRTEWIKVTTENRGLSTSELRRLLPTTYPWLRRNDSEWFRENRGTYKSWRSKKADYWVQRDMDCVNRLYESAARITNMPGKPQRISRRKLLLDAGCKSIVEKHPDRTPLAIKALEELIEDVIVFALRKIEYFIQLYKETDTRISRRRFMANAALYPYKDHPEIQEAVDQAMIILNS